MAKNRNISNIQQIQKVSSRPGEGAALDVTRQHIASSDGTTVLSLAIDLRTAPAPDRRYVANVAGVVYDGDRLTLIFGQKQLGGGGLYRSLLLIEMPSTCVLQFLLASQGLVSGVVKYMQGRNIANTQLSEISGDVPGQTVPLAANIVAAGYTGRDACMDFYYASPFSVEIAGTGGVFAAEPVVRVNLSTALMVAIYEKLTALKDSLPDERIEEAK